MKLSKLLLIAPLSLGCLLGLTSCDDGSFAPRLDSIGFRFEENGIIRWGYENSFLNSGYVGQLKLGIDDKIININPERRTYYQVSSLEDGDHSFSLEMVVSNGEHTYFSSYESETLSISNLKSPSNLTYDGKFINFEPVEFADYYLVSYDYKQYKIDDTKLEETLYDTTLIKVTACSTKFDHFASKAAEKLVKFLPEPCNLNIDKGYLTWDDIPLASSFEIRLNHEYLGTSYNNEYKLPLTLTGECNFTICAHGDNKEYFDSRYSKEFTYNFL